MSKAEREVGWTFERVAVQEEKSRRTAIAGSS